MQPDRPDIHGHRHGGAGYVLRHGARLRLTAVVHGRIHVLDPTEGTGSFDITMSGNGQTVTGHAAYMGKWVRASCPAA